MLEQAQAHSTNRPAPASPASCRTSGRRGTASPTSPTSEAAKEAVVAAGEQLATTSSTSSARSSRRSPARRANSTKRSPGRRAKSQASPTRSRSSTARSSSPKKPGSRPTRCSTVAICCSTSSPALANITVTEEPDHMDTVSFGEAAKPLVEGTNVNWPQDTHRILRRAARRAARADRPPGRPDRSCRRGSTASRKRSRAPSTNTSPSRSSQALRAATLAVAVNPPKSRPRGPKPRAATKWPRRSRRCAAAPPNRATRRSSRRSAATCRRPRTNESNLQTTVTAISDQRQSVSGVSLDEEMTNLITFQRGYQASARTLTAMSEMLETLIEHTGVVGL